MKKHIKQTLAGALSLASLCTFTTAFAGDISYELRNNKKVENYFEIGLGAHSYSGPSHTKEDGDNTGIHAVVNGSYNWNGFFIDLYGESATPLILGYNAFESENWSFDVTLGPNNFGFDESDDDRYIGLDERDTDIMLGGRLIGRFGSNIVQFNAQHDISGSHQGHSFSAQLGRNWQYKDWNFHGLVGAHYSDNNVNDYYHGVTAAEAQRTDYYAYDLGSSLALSAEVGVTYPINENWTFRTTARYVDLDEEITNSPLFLDNSDQVTGIQTSVSYVF